MGDWYWIGVTAGLGAACGVAFAAVFARERIGWLAAALLGAGGGVAIGFAFFEWDEAIAGAVGGLVAALAVVQVVRGALARGGTRVATAFIVVGGAVAVAALAFVPALGYLETVLLAGVGLRARRQAGQRYAGLRILARD